MAVVNLVKSIYTSTDVTSLGEIASTDSVDLVVRETTDTVYTITDGAAFEIDPTNGNVQMITLGAARTPKGTNFAAGQCVLLGVDDGSAYAITWSDTTFSGGAGSGVTWVSGAGSATAPTLATSGYTWILLWKVGTLVYGALVGKP